MNDPFWMETLACPRCRSPLDNLRACRDCGTGFPPDGILPRLTAPGAACDVRFQYSSEDYGYAKTLQNVLHEPPQYGGGGLPYHLDRAHAHRIANLPAGSRVLEIGCGGGQNRAWVEGRGQKYVGTDVSKTRVFEWLQQYGGPDLLCDAHFLPFRDRQFDVVYAAATTEHLACPQRVAQEVFRTLKPGGYYLANVSFLEAWHDNSYFHMTPLGVIELLTRAGFEIEYVWPGRGYSGFHALNAMAYRGPFRLMRTLGKASHAVYRFQNSIRNWIRRLRGKDSDCLLRQQAVVAGAIDWIARRPAESGEERLRVAA